MVWRKRIGEVMVPVASLVALALMAILAWQMLAVQTTTAEVTARRRVADRFGTGRTPWGGTYLPAEYATPTGARAQRL